MKICFFQIFKSSFSQPFLTIALSFSTLSNQYCFIISLKSTISWFSRNPPHSIIVVLRSKQILFLHLMTTFIHKITHNKVCIVLPWFCGFGWPGNPSPVETPVPNLRAPIVFLQFLGLLAEVVVRNKQQLGWFLRPESQVSSIFHFSVFFQQVAVGENGKKCWGILQIVFHPTLIMTSKGPAHQNSTFGVDKWLPKLHSMFPQAGDPKVIIVGTSKHIFWNYSNLNPAWSISESTLLKLLQLNVRRHSPITHAHSMTCRWTSFNMQLVPDPKVYFPGTSTLEGPQHTRPAPWGHMFHPFALLHLCLLHH